MKIEDEIRQPTFASPLQRAMVNLQFTYHWFADKTDSIFKSHDLTRQQFNILRILRGKHPQVVPVGDVKDVMLDKNPDLTRLCDRLVQKQLIRRCTDEANRRQVLLGITELGFDKLERIGIELKGASEAHIGLTEIEAVQLSELLDKMRKA